MEALVTDFIIAVSVADIRRDPDATSELVTQALMNTSAQAGEVSGEWTHITLVDYSGWVRTDELAEPIVRGVCEGEEGTCGVALPYSLVVTAPHTALYTHSEGAETTGEIYLSTALPYIDLAHPQRLRVALPGDKEAWVAREDVEMRSNAELFPVQDLSVVTAYAMSFLDVPYLWGGTSWRGIDCSAFVQLCHRMGGNILPRDADQQFATLAESLPRERMQKGDLIFFGQQRITHVGLALNKYEYIHAEGQNFEHVIIHSLDPAHPAYYAYLSERVWGIKRVRSE